ncbi:uncharacterized protein AC631_03037 [Debaryomyces fabryi]|uniref:DASH complex subunit DUO1 n=1 Tax=Debaryomyces fabryi TaxID=58627 RepID=A0A0V1PYI9_9ASCO|nr:uncharacterized protein AC631_03037 [Debaryomyces fabryi]KSA01218.1 hypothetical protein AC631_03037 [Debaryomyces fabryi]CUM52786.1 unnamed protein product [Debaryomyces fabryi]
MSSSKRQIALEKELQQLTAINTSVATMIEAIRSTQTNIMKTQESTENTDKLLNQWIRILSQTNFTNEILQNPHWNGSTEIDDEEIEIKLNEEQELINDLNELINENSELSKTIEQKEQKEKLDENRRRELISRRHKELGLRSVPKKRGTSRVYK